MVATTLAHAGKENVEGESVVLKYPLAGVTAAVIVTMCDPRQYPTARQLEKACGMILREKSSGQTKGQLSISKRGPGLVRKVMYLFALRMIQANEIVRAWYMRRKGYTEGSKQRAVVAVMRKLTRAMFHIAKGNAFDASKLFDVRRLDLDSTKAFAEEARVVAPTTTSATAKETTETESKATSSEETSVAASQVTATTGTMERTASQETTVATEKETSPTAKQDMSEQTASQETTVATAKQTSPIAKTAKGKKKIVPEKTPAATVSETDVAASKVANTTASSTEASVEAPQPAAAPTSSDSNALPRDASD